MSRRVDYENPRGYANTTVKRECDSMLSLHGVKFQCIGAHGPRGRHRASAVAESGEVVFLEWSAWK